MGWIGIFSWIVVMIGNTNSVQGVVQIGLTARSDKAARNGYILGAALMVPVGFICALLGVASKALLPDSTGAEAAIFEAGLGGFNAMHALSTRKCQ